MTTHTHIHTHTARWLRKATTGLLVAATISLIPATPAAAASCFTGTTTPRLNVTYDGPLFYDVGTIEWASGLHCSGVVVGASLTSTLETGGAPYVSSTIAGVNTSEILAEGIAACPARLSNWTSSAIGSWYDTQNQIQASEAQSSGSLVTRCIELEPITSPVP